MKLNLYDFTYTKERKFGERLAFVIAGIIAVGLLLNHFGVIDLPLNCLGIFD